MVMVVCGLETKEEEWHGLEIGHSILEDRARAGENTGNFSLYEQYFNHDNIEVGAGLFSSKKFQHN